MEGALILWPVILAVGALNYLSRLSFIAAFGRRSMPGWLARSLKFVPAAMLTALVLPMIVGVPPSDVGRMGASKNSGGDHRRRGGVLHPQHTEDTGGGNAVALVPAVADGCSRLTAAGHRGSDLATAIFG